MMDWIDLAYFSVIPLSFLAVGAWVLYINRHDMKPQEPKTK